MIRHIGVNIGFGAGPPEAAPAASGAGYYKRRKAWWRTQHLQWCLLFLLPWVF